MKYSRAQRGFAHHRAWSTASLRILLPSHWFKILEQSHMPLGSGEQCRAAQARGGWAESPLDLSKEGGSLTPLTSRSKNVGPVLPDFQQTWKTELKCRMLTPKVESQHRVSAGWAKSRTPPTSWEGNALEAPPGCGRSQVCRREEAGEGPGS